MSTKYSTLLPLRSGVDVLELAPTNLWESNDHLLSSNLFNKILLVD